MNNYPIGMTVVEYLSQAYHIDQRINCKLEQIMSLRELLTKVSVALSDMPRVVGGNTNSMANIITKIVDFEDEINADIDRLVDLKREIAAYIRATPKPEHQILLEQRYLFFKQWKEISAMLGYDVRYVRKLHNQALEEISERLCAATA